ncbi:MAG: hypothetical protein PHN74_00590 [Candidatus Pacebacteria bacterium]|nr:hypothetical protein [Candidatus Paceibacterota bacterium]
MPVYNIAFYVCVFFLVGVLIISIFSNVLMVALAAFLISVCLVVYKKYIFALLFLFVIVGAFYSQIFNKIQNSANVPFGASEFSGVIIKIAQGDTKQDII